MITRTNVRIAAVLTGVLTLTLALPQCSAQEVPPTTDAYRASTPGADFIAAIGSLHELLGGRTLERALASDNRLVASEAVAQLSARIDLLYKTGKAYRQHEQELGREPISRFVINDADMGEIRQLLIQYRDASTDDAKTTTTQSVKKLVEEFQEVYARHWPNDIGVTNAQPRAVGRSAQQGPPVDAVFITQPPASTRRGVVYEEATLPDGRRVRSTRTVPAAGPNLTVVSQPGAITPFQNRYQNSGPFNTEIRQAVEALRNAKDDDAKAAATVALIKLLDETFDQDMRRREQEVAQIEERVKNLRSQFDLRREKRQEIIDLQIKVLENEAAGLGFFSQPARPHPDDHPVNRETVWSCSMHPQVGSSAPGKCPICGMDLVQVARAAPSNTPSLPQIATPPTYVVPLQTRPALVPANATPPAMTPRTPPGTANTGRTRAEVNQAKAQVAMLANAIRMYQLNVREYPAGIQGLLRPPTDAERARRWAGPYLEDKQGLLDPWGREYRFVAPGIVNPTSFDVWSAGPDGQVGTADDIGNWDAARRR